MSWWGAVRLLYLRELRTALRERAILIYSFLVPVLLYPLLFWLILTAVNLASGQTERFVSRIALVDLPERHAGLRRALEETPQVELVAPPVEDAAAAVREGELDAVARIVPAAAHRPPAATLAGNFRLELTYDASRDRSAKAQERLVAVLDTYREGWIRNEAAGLGVDAATWEQVRVERENVASGRQLGAFVLGLLAPLILVVMVAAGSLYPAIDATAGERERSTWETLLTVAAPRHTVVVAKYLYVATFGCVSGLLNLAAMTFTLRSLLAPLLGDAGADLEFRIPLLALPVVVMATLLLALFIAAAMMIFAAFARTFKEGQAMIGPFYLLIMLPLFFAQAPDRELTPALALVPIANVMLLFRSVIAGSFPWPLIGLTLLVEAVTVATCVALAGWILRFEDVVLGSFHGSLGTFLKSRLTRRSGRAGAEVGG